MINDDDIDIIYIQLRVGVYLFYLSIRNLILFLIN